MFNKASAKLQNLDLNVSKVYFHCLSLNSFVNTRTQNLGKNDRPLNKSDVANNYREEWLSFRLY